jgi:hypothetical protein
LATEAFRVDDEDVITEPAAVREGMLALPSAVAAAGAMVVLGEPGAGKTSMLESLTTGLPRVLDSWERNADACLWVTGADLTEASYQDELGRHLDALPSAGKATDDAGVGRYLPEAMTDVGIYLVGWVPGRTLGRSE